MGIAKSKTIRFTPKGLHDAWDSTDTFPGACRILKDLIFDQSNPELVACRPGVSVITSFGGFSSPGVISVFVAVGTRIYGMIGTSRNAGKDEPFCYDTATGGFVTIGGTITGATCPITQSTSGDWTPPTMAMIASKIIITHPGYPGTAGNMFGVIDVSNPAAPSYNIGDLATNGLPSQPLCVANYNNRAYFGCANAAVPFSDTLNPTTRTNASQQLQVGNQDQIQGMVGLPVQTASGGVLAALIVFKRSETWQVTGDGTGIGNGNLALNYLSLNIGTLSPRSAVQSQNGVYFASTSGPYYINPLGGVIPLTHGSNDSEPDIQAPFQNCTLYSRVCGNYEGTIWRVCLDTIILGTAARNDYWFDDHRRRWHGPHSFSYHCADSINQYFVLSSNTAPGILFKSQTQADSTSVYTDNGTTISPLLQPATLPKSGSMTQKQVVESTIELSAAGAPQAYTITAIDELQNQLNQVVVNTISNALTWGSGILWGSGPLWASSVQLPKVYTIPWSIPLVFQKLALQVTTPASVALSIGTFYARYQDLGYTNTLPR